MSTTQKDRLRELLEPLTQELGLDLEDVEVSFVGRRGMLRVVVDADGGADMDAVADVARAVSEALEDSDVMGPDAYTLEVGTPGVDRPLNAPRHWRRAVGRIVEAQLHDGTVVVGRLLDAGEESASVEAEKPAPKKGMKPKKTVRDLTYAEVAKAAVQVEFNRKDAELLDDADDDADFSEDELEEFEDEEAFEAAETEAAEDPEITDSRKSPARSTTTEEA
jgi:ribosome maturation factor RimP